MLSEIEQFVNWVRRRNPDARTWKDYGYDLSQFAALVGDRPPGEITFRDIDRFVELQKSHGFQPSSINRRLACVTSFYTFLSDEDPELICPVLPRRHYLRERERLPRPVQEDQLAAFFAAIEQAVSEGVPEALRDRAMFLLMLRCGLRVGEVRNLSLNDLYLDPAHGSLPRLWLHGKGGGQRVAYLSSQPLAALQVWLDIRPRVKDDAVFLNRFNRRLSVTGIQKRLMTYCHQAGIWVTCHQLRHTFGRHLTEARIPVTSIQRLLGHAHLETTQVYLHISDRNLQADYDAAMRAVCRKLDGLDKGGQA